MVELIYANNLEDALNALENGFEPVECSFGDKSVVGKHILDHHGKYAGEEAVSIKAVRLALKGVTLDKFVVTGTADCDQCYAIAALNGSIHLSLDEAAAVAEMDTDPIGRDFTSNRYIKILMHRQITDGLPNCLESTYSSLDALIRIFNDNYTNADVNDALQKEEQRKQRMKTQVVLVEEGKVALVRSDSAEWGFDVWYGLAPIVVVYKVNKSSVTIGLCPKKGGTLADKTGFDLLGNEGLMRAVPLLNTEIIEGWGGRKTIIGSPRNTPMSYEDAVKVYELIRKIIL